MHGKTLDDMRAIELFVNKTGRHNHTMDDVAAWIEEHHVMPMPEPQTPRQMLAERLSRSAGGARRRDPQSSVEYRAHLVHRVEENGQYKFYWFDADGPAATEERMEAATHPRKELALNIGVQVTADWDHFYRTHSTLQPKRPDFDLNWEIGLRMGGTDEIEKGGRKAG